MPKHRTHRPFIHTVMVIIMNVVITVLHAACHRPASAPHTPALAPTPSTHLPQLRIVTTRGVEAAADDLPSKLPAPPKSAYTATGRPFFHPISLVPSLPATTSDATSKHLKRDYTSLMPRGPLLSYLTSSNWHFSTSGSAAALASAVGYGGGAEGSEHPTPDTSHHGAQHSSRRTTRQGTDGSVVGGSPTPSMPHSPRHSSARGPGSSAASVADSELPGRPEYGVGAEYMYFVAGPEVGGVRRCDATGCRMPSLGCGYRCRREGVRV